MHVWSPGWRYRRQLVTPFVPTAPVDYYWCNHCQQDVTVETDHGRWEQVDVYRKRCLRCGRTVLFGMRNSVFKSQDDTVVKAAWKFITSRGQDRT